jgi:hypothetical protein
MANHQTHRRTAAQSAMLAGSHRLTGARTQRHSSSYRNVTAPAIAMSQLQLSQRHSFSYRNVTASAIATSQLQLSQGDQNVPDGTVTRWSHTNPLEPSLRTRTVGLAGRMAKGERKDHCQARIKIGHESYLDPSIGTLY